MWHNIFSIIKSEVRSYISSPAAYIFVIIFLILSGFFTFMVGNFFEAGQASLERFFVWHPWLYLILIPAIGMHLWAEERRQGTIEWLFTMPITLPQVVIGKFIAAWLIVAFALAMTFPMILSVYYLGNPDPGPIICGYLGSILMAGSYLAVTCFTSSLTRSQVISFILSVVICLFMIISGWPPVTGMLVEWAPQGLVDAIAYFSVIPHFTSLQRGVVDSRDLLYYLSVIIVALVMTGVTLKHHRD